MSQSQRPYFFAPQPTNPNIPLFVFLPGMDETGKDLMTLQTAHIATRFDVRCFVIPPDELTNWDILSEQVIALTQAELRTVPRFLVYLCGESFGGCLALKVLLKSPELFQSVILINSASSFHRVPWLNFSSLLFPWTPKLIYKISSLLALPFLAPIKQLSPMARQALSKATRAPQKTAEQRLKLMREFKVDETQLKQFPSPILLIGSEGDRLLPSVNEAYRLAKIFPNAQVVTLPHKGHACLVEQNVNLLQILENQNFTNRRK